MKVFLSWSGPLSKSIAEYFKGWLPGVVQQVDEIFISSDISKGEPWFETITKNLDDVDLGLVFITKENRNATWLNFEAGAMVNKFGQSGIRPILVDITTGEYDGPMKNLQLAELQSDEDMRKLLGSINDKIERPLDSTVLDSTFDMWKQVLFDNVAQRIEARRQNVGEEPEVRSDSEKIDELLDLSRLLASQESQRRHEFERLVHQERERQILEAHRASEILRSAREQQKPNKRPVPLPAEDAFAELVDHPEDVREAQRHRFIRKYGTLMAHRIPGGEVGEVVGYRDADDGRLAYIDFRPDGGKTHLRLRRGEFEIEPNLIGLDDLEVH
ncbi:hypothetical protein [Paenarthrobacter nicotinovorans]|uniref:hypothetical protein n=1 Tax=Paenarthrobacter nicotinovorans TaxID=29320 RepID=UPI0018D38B1D|nr:hypothetical protein [Paenarthrobacter nicotinovorans]